MSATLLHQGSRSKPASCQHTVAHLLLPAQHLQAHNGCLQGGASIETARRCLHKALQEGPPPPDLIFLELALSDIPPPELEGNALLLHFEHVVRNAVKWANGTPAVVLVQVGLSFLLRWMHGAHSTYWFEPRLPRTTFCCQVA